MGKIDDEGMSVPDIQFNNTRFDPDLSIPGLLAQLLRLRVSQMNPCSYCLILRSKAAEDQGIR